ncbi:MAG: sulfatase-like hydrolase/transferase [Lachnospiraceae bacterium]|nr:sulfatase-like hydrolase/transferase [Lachnospiraceae bacterium]
MKLRTKLKNVFGTISKPFKQLKLKIDEKKKQRAEKEPTKFQKAYKKFKIIFEKYAVISHIFVSLIMVFIIEWMSRHSFIQACMFVKDHTIAYLYNSFIVYVGFSLVFITKRRAVMRLFVGGVFIVLGLINCILLLNRVSPFGFTDFYMVSDLLTMQGSKYFSTLEEVLVIVGAIAFTALLIILFIKGPKYESKKPFILRLLFVVIVFISLPATTLGLRKTNKLASYFGNLSEGYANYGYLYGFGTSVFSRGMSKPLNYSENTVKSIVKQDKEAVGKTTLSKSDQPNIVVVLLESFFDPYDCKFLSFSEDPTPFFHKLQKEYSTGHFVSPVVGAGTCNPEFEVLTSMSVNFFGPGEYPQKTVMKKINSCESSADTLKDLGYKSHVVHNNGANFYSRKNAFSLMGFDTFTAKENLDITDYTPLGSWPTDDILIDSTKDSMDSTKGSDFVYTITVSTHGNYPTYKVLDNPEIKVTAKGKSESEQYAWEYYINQIHEMDKWMENYVKSFEERGEKTLLLMFGDHLPSLNLLDSDMKTGSIFNTNYCTWNNFGMEKQDKDLTAYQLLPEYFNRLGIHGGTMLDYNQRMLKEGEKYNSLKYQSGLQTLQYDLLYGKHYATNQKELYPATNILMGIHDIKINNIYTFDKKVHLYGDNFTKWSYAYVNEKKVPTHYESGQVLTFNSSEIEDGDTIEVCQVASGEDILRKSNKVVYSDPEVLRQKNQAEGSEEVKLDQPDDSEPNETTVEN